MSKENTLFEKAKLALKALFTDADAQTIEKFKAELEDSVIPNGSEPTKVKTKEGVEMVVEGGLVEGSKISLVNPENGEIAPAMDGDYELEDGTKISVTGGLITKVEKKAAEPAPNPAPAEAEMTAKMAAQSKEFEAKLSEAVKPLNDTIVAQAKVIETLKVQQKFVLGKLEAIAKAPVITEKVTPEKPFEEMSGLEKRRYLKNK